jgi:predicted DNA-binding ribbon-helix-helix protein
MQRVAVVVTVYLIGRIGYTVTDFRVLPNLPKPYRSDVDRYGHDGYTVIEPELIEDVLMALTNAEKQARYRERHLGIDGEKTRVQLFLSVEAKAQLERVARHRGYTVTALVEELAARADQNIAHRLTGKALTEYLDGPE